jgi:hypothetical protein
MKAREQKEAALEANLQNAHEKLSNIIKHSLSDYAKKMVWDNEKKVVPIQESDPTPVRLSKLCLLALQDTEALAQVAPEILHRFQGRGVGGMVWDELGEAVSLAATTGRNIYKENEDKEENRESPKILTAVQLTKQLSGRLQAIAQLAAEAKLPQDIRNQFTATSALMAQTPQTTLNNSFGTALSDVITTYFATARPDVPVQPERKYESKQEINCEVLIQAPTSYEEFKPDSYLLVQTNNKASPWQLIYLNKEGHNYPVDIDDVPNLPTILKGKTTGKEITGEIQAAIKANLANRWNPSMQDRSEWFLLIEPLRSAMQGTQSLHGLLKKFIDDAKSRGMELDEEQVKLIEQTLAALKDATFDENGYYEYEKNETPLSQSLKGIFNVIWSINELSKGYWENPGAAAHFQMATHAKKALDHYWKILWPQLGGNFGAIGDQLVNAMLVYGKDMAFDRLEQLAQTSHDLEFQHHLRFGALSENIRPLFDGLESVYQERNLGVLTNPFGYNEATEKKLEEKLKAAQAKETSIKAELDFLNPLAKKLQWYKDYAEDITQPSLAGSRYGTLPIIEELEKTAISLLLDLRDLKLKNELSEEQLVIIGKLEDRLIADLPLENKQTLLNKCLKIGDKHTGNLRLKLSQTIAENKKHAAEEKAQSYLQRGRKAMGSLLMGAASTYWPKAEFNSIIQHIDNLKKVSQEKALEVAKYAEAVSQHKKMQKEFALRTLKKDGLISLIEAVRQDPMNEKSNLAQKRKLATLLADIHGEKRSEYLTKKQAPIVAREFALNNDGINDFIHKVYEEGKEVGHALAVEALLAGYVPISSFEDSSIWNSENPKLIRQDILNALDRLEAKQVLAMIPENNQEPVSDKAKVFLTLFNGIEILEEGLSKDKLIKLMVDNYNRVKNIPGNEEITNKIGLFLGRLAHADSDTAKIIFEEDDAHTILRTECLPQDKGPKKKAANIRTDRALYFESLVNTFDFSYKEKKHEKESREFNIFIADNKKIIFEIYKALNPDTTKNSTEVLAEFSTIGGKEKLMDLLNDFTKTCLSPNSAAELKLREFFSAILLCKDNTVARDIILEFQHESHDSSKSKFLDLLTPEASYPFWHQVREDLIAKPQHEITNEFKFELESWQAKLNSISNADERKELSDKITNFIKVKEAEIKTATEIFADSSLKEILHLPSSKKNIPLQCRHAIQEINKVKRELAEQKLQWQIEYQDCLLKQTDQNHQASIELNKKLGEVINVLDQYLSERGNKSASVKSAMGFRLQADKVALVKEFREKFDNLQGDVVKNPNQVYAYATQVNSIGEELDQRHQELLDTHNQSQKAGKLGKAITTTSLLLSRNSHPSTNPTQKDDLEKPISLITKIINTIRSTFSSKPTRPQSTQMFKSPNIDSKYSPHHDKSSHSHTTSDKKHTTKRNSTGSLGS